jgi:hypothetical protein
MTPAIRGMQFDGLKTLSSESNGNDLCKEFNSFKGAMSLDKKQSTVMLEACMVSP